MKTAAAINRAEKSSLVFLEYSVASCPDISKKAYRKTGYSH